MLPDENLFDCSNMMTECPSTEPHSASVVKHRDRKRSGRDSGNAEFGYRNGIMPTCCTPDGHVVVNSAENFPVDDDDDVDGMLDTVNLSVEKHRTNGGMLLNGGGRNLMVSNSASLPNTQIADPSRHHSVAANSGDVCLFVCCGGHTKRHRIFCFCAFFGVVLVLTVITVLIFSTYMRPEKPRHLR